MPEIEVQIAPPDSFPMLSAAQDSTLTRMVLDSATDMWPILLSFTLYAVLFAWAMIHFGMVEVPKWRGWVWNGEDDK